MRELDLIRTISLQNQGNHPNLSCGIGDDCAIFTSSPHEEMLVSTDMLVEHVHFNTSWHPPYQLGRKTMAVNISDIAAMAGIPRFALLSIGMTGDQDDSWMHRFMEGVFSILKEFDCILIGGDTVSSANLTFSVTILGVGEKSRSIRRNGAKAGDKVLVSGKLGSAAVALQLFLNGERDTRGWQKLADKHLDPTPQVGIAQLLKKSGAVTAMQDISDGIATDLSHICTASGVKASIYSHLLPGDDEFYSICKQRHMDPLQFQLSGGEDYELIFTVKRDEADSLKESFLTRYDTILYEIGEISEGEGVFLKRADTKWVPISYKGYEHRSK